MRAEHMFAEVMAVPAKPEVHPWSGGVRTYLTDRFTPLRGAEADDLDGEE